LIGASLSSDLPFADFSDLETLPVFLSLGDLPCLLRLSEFLSPDAFSEEVRRSGSDVSFTGSALSFGFGLKLVNLGAEEAMGLDEQCRTWCDE
jgi:hypothetical protein